MHILKTFNKPSVNFLRVWTKITIYWKFRENFSKKFQKKIAIGKIHFKGVGLVGDPGGGAPRTPDNFRKFAKKSGNCKKRTIYHIFQNSLKTMRSIFAPLDEKHKLVGKF